METNFNTFQKNMMTCGIGLFKAGLKPEILNYYSLLSFLMVIAIWEKFKTDRTAYLFSFKYFTNWLDIYYC